MKYHLAQRSREYVTNVRRCKEKNRMHTNIVNGKIFLCRIFFIVIFLLFHLINCVLFIDNNLMQQHPLLMGGRCAVYEIIFHYQLHINSLKTA
jgi:hypothetical protein